MAEDEKKQIETESKKDEKAEEKKETKSAIEKAKEKLEEVKNIKKDSKKTEASVVLEREYIIPLRKKVLKAQRYRRAKKAIAVIREFLVRHMKVEDRDIRKIKIDKYLNEEVWFRGIKKPMNKIKVKAIKMSDGIVKVELADVPDFVKFKKQKDEKRKSKVDEKKMKKIVKQENAEKDLKEERSGENKTETKEEIKDEVEKEKAVVDAGLKSQKTEAKTQKHTASGKHKQATTPVRKALKK